MAIDTAVIYGGIATIGILAGWVFRGIRHWFTVDRDIKELTKIVERTDDDVKIHGNKLNGHIRDADVHIVPKYWVEFTKNINDHFTDFGKKLDSMDVRCESRRLQCEGKFSDLHEAINDIERRT